MKVQIGFKERLIRIFSRQKENNFWLNYDSYACFEQRLLVDGILGSLR